MTKPKPKKTCEFEAMRAVTEHLAGFTAEERARIIDGVNARFDAMPQPKPRGRKPKANGAHPELAS